MTSEKHLLGCLAQLRESLAVGQITAIGHLVGTSTLSGPGTKYASPILWALLDVTCSGWADLTSPRTEFIKVARYRAFR